MDIHPTPMNITNLTRPFQYEGALSRDRQEDSTGQRGRAESAAQNETMTLEQGNRLPQAAVDGEKAQKNWPDKMKEMKILQEMR
jgi:hypothetical protein